LTTPSGIVVNTVPSVLTIVYDTSETP
jgi:hypothetical protein